MKYSPGQGRDSIDLKSITKIITKTSHQKVTIKKSNWTFVMIFMMIFVMFFSLLNWGPGIHFLSWIENATIHNS